MSTRKGLGYSPLTDSVFFGKQNPEKRMWVGEKLDVTNDFVDVAHHYFEENTIRNIKSDVTDNLFINIKNDPESMQKVIDHLTARIEKMNKPKKARAKAK